MKFFEHQQKFIDESQSRPRLILNWDCGIGKTIAILAAIDAEKKAGRLRRTLIVAPKSVLRTAWLRDAGNFPDLKVELAWSQNKRNRVAVIYGDADVMVTNFEQFKMHAGDYLAAGIKRLVIDESSKIKACRANGSSSQIADAAVAFSDKMESVYLLSGTPASNNEVEWYNQIRCIDKYTSGLQSFAFAARWCVPLKRKIYVRGMPKDVITGWVLRQDKRDAFVEMLAGVAWTLRSGDCIDLPDETESIREVELSEPERRAYRAMLDELKVEASDGEAVTVQGSAKLMKLRQITGGSVLVDGEAVAIGDAKLKALDELLEEIGGQAVIWAEFTHEIDAIHRRLENCKYIDGRVHGDVRAEHIADFQAGRLKYLVCHPAAAGHGVTLTAARHDVFFSLGWVPENHDQARKRIHRIGQKWPVEHHYLIVPGSVDEKVYEVLKRKKTASDAIRDLLAGSREMAVA